jgi:hypothetical protein
MTSRQGAVSEGPYRTIVYIDGFNLYFGLKDAGFRRYYWLDVQTLAERLLLPTQRLAGVKYFTSRISGPPDKRLRQNAFLEAVATRPLVRMFFGHYLTHDRVCQRCNYMQPVPSEKMTDVNISVQLLRDAFEDQFDTAIVVSADSDLCPPIEAVKELFCAKRVVACFPPERASKRLRTVCHASMVLGRRLLADSQFPPEVRKATAS